MRKRSRSLALAAIASVGVLAVVLSGCRGTAGPPGASTGVLSGTITNSLTNGPLDGVKVSFDPAVASSVTTNASGKYSVSLPIGIYTVSYQRASFTAATQTVSIVAGQTISRNVPLKPVAPVVVSAGAGQTSQPGGTVTLDAKAEVLDGSSLLGYHWMQAAGVPATFPPTAGPSATKLVVTLADGKAYKVGLVGSLERLDRYMVSSINPEVLQEAETTTFKVTVTTSSGNYTASVDVVADLPYVVSTGLRNVPNGLPVLLHGKDQSRYDWSLLPPGGSTASLDAPTEQDPAFTPDVSGKYTVVEKASNTTIVIYSGTWVGAITGQDSNGLPLSVSCTSCHNGKIAPDNFTAWRQTGHAQILTQNVNTNGHYDESCFPCHTVGFDKEADNGGIDEAPGYDAFLTSGILGSAKPDNWSKMLANFPRVAALSNAQCENCHGPNNTAVHAIGKTAAERVSIAADVCGTCHGEPLRHGRFQQWETSKHSDFELAIEESGNNHCGRCHTGQGFLAWIAQGDLTKRIQGANGDATAAELAALGMTRDTVQPQTCAVCHDPHATGNLSGEPTNATVRIENDTPLLPAGFRAFGVGKGAICITCHNTRNGLHNDANPPVSYSAPHSPAQGDVLLGENAYFVDRERSPHSYVEDSCVTCHMEKTPPPPLLSYQQSGTNHAFAASLTICASCHSDTLNAASLQASHRAQLESLGTSLGRYLLQKLPTRFAIKEYTPHTLGGNSYDLKSDTIVLSRDNVTSAAPVEIHGQISFALQLKTAVTATYRPANQTPHTLSLSTVQVQLGDITAESASSAVIPLTDVLVKAAWDYFLIHGDASFGIHNPTYVNDVLNAALDALFPGGAPKE